MNWFELKSTAWCAALILAEAVWIVFVVALPVYLTFVFLR